MPISPATSLNPVPYPEEHHESFKPLRRRVLIVEDEEGALKLLERRFRKMGFDVAAAQDGLDALDQARRKESDLIILDLVLPKLSGEEVCKAIREDDDRHISGIPIIMLTGKDTVADRIVGKVIGANAYLTKPFDFDDLMDKVIELSIPE
ncbi:MAG TPA: response regulator [Verrucomicrobiae bacterium]|jgi:DNA-binding response OmpR family regulator|nr:response regulator [Verrucomicrobiae bacterium]